MLTREQFGEMKNRSLTRGNMESAERVIADFKSATSQQKKDIRDLAGFSSNSTIYNIAKSGSASVKTILATAQTLDVSPYYYLCATDEKGSCTNKIIKKFLEEFDTGLKLNASPAGRKPKKVVECEEEVECDSYDCDEAEELVIVAVADEEDCDCEECEPVIEISLEVNGSEKMQNAVDELDEEDAVILLMALFKKAEVSKEAAGLCEIVKFCLLS